MQAAAAVEALSMNDSIPKQPDFASPDYDDSVARPIVGIPDLPDQAEEEDNEEGHPSVAATIKKEEAHEPLLQENPHRFVLFPIKYHEVRVFDASTRKVARDCRC